MRINNKAHTATMRRIARRYDAQPVGDGEIDLQGSDLIVGVETTATLPTAIPTLNRQMGRVYVAMTNREGISFALRLTAGTRLGVMDPDGNIIKEASLN